MTPKPIDNATLAAKRSEAQTLGSTLHIGKGGTTEDVVRELDAQLTRRRLVKARLLPATQSHEGSLKEQAQRLAEATRSHLVEVRGHTAVFYRPRGSG